MAAAHASAWGCATPAKTKPNSLLSVLNKLSPFRSARSKPLLDRAPRQTLYDVTLEHDNEENHGHDHDHRERAHEVPWSARSGTDARCQLDQAEREWLGLGTGREYEGVEQLVPGDHEVYEEHGGEGRHR